MTLRPAVPDDAPSLAALSFEVWIGTYLHEGISPFFANYALDTFRTDAFLASLQQPDTCFIVSQNSVGIDGFIRLDAGRSDPVDGRSDLEISTLYVQPRHHGKGIGHALLQAGLDWARDQGAASVWLTTNSANTPAIGFYKAQGFDVVGQTHFTIEDQAYLNEVLVKAL